MKEILTDSLIIMHTVSDAYMIIITLQNFKFEFFDRVFLIQAPHSGTPHVRKLHELIRFLWRQLASLNEHLTQHGLCDY